MQARYFFLFAIIIICGSSILTAKTFPEGIVVPGVRVGYITAGTTEAELIRDYGEENVIATFIGVGEGEVVPGTILMPNDSTQSLAIIWKDANPNRNPSEIRISGKVSKWKTAEGISLGITLKELEKLNNAPFHLMGFSWDYEGTVMDCGNGKLKYLGTPANLMDNEIKRSLIIRLGPTEETLHLIPEDVYLSVVGDHEFSSDCAGMQKINPVVYEMIVVFPQSEE